MEIDSFPATPSPGHSSALHTPPTPLHGYNDSWEPYTPRRKSQRISQRTSNRTPSPQPTTRRGITTSSLGSPKSSKHNKNHRVSTMSPAASPRKKHTPILEPVRRAPGAVTSEATTSAAVTLGLGGHGDFFPGRASLSAAAGMLITPAKTPQKAPTEESKAKIKAVARSLFSETEIMPSPKKTRTQKYTLDSFSANDEAEEDIQIYTDSHERIPEVDRSANNPFYGDQPTLAPRRSKRQTVTIPGEGQVSVEDAVNRDDGMIFVFRGKKRFHKFSDDSNEFPEASGAESERRRTTRSSIKPRLLFPAKVENLSIANDDEEAATDIEDHVLAGEETKSNPETPAELTTEVVPPTPEAPRFDPVSPPPTGRATRLSKKMETTPVKGKQTGSDGKQRSPFAWRVTKSSGSQSGGHKRAGEELSSGPSKRTRA